MGWTVVIVLALVWTLGMAALDGRRPADRLIGKR
jgi:hypothetical protein